MTTPLVVDEFLEHYGTKGMKWGVRRDLKRLAPGDRAGYIAAKDAKWLAKVEKNPKLSKVSRLTTRYAKKQTKKLKQDYKDRGLNIKKSSLARSRYDNEVKVILDQALEKATYKAHKLSPSRLNEVQVQRHPDGTMTAKVVARNNAKVVKQFKTINKADERRQKAAAKTVKHAAEDALQLDEMQGLEFFLVVDDDGFVDDILSPFPEDSIEQSETDGMTFTETLAHYGIKGMKWGVRRSPSQLSSGTSSTKKPSWAADPPDHAPAAAKKSFGKKVKKTQERSPDDIVFNALRQKAKEGGISSLSNDEIRVLTSRADALEKYKRSFPTPKSKKQKVADYVIQDLLVKSGKKQISAIVDEQMKQFGVKKGLRAPDKNDKKKDDD